MEKIEVVRRQLGTALELFINDADPVSVHTLACAACEIVEELARKAGHEPFVSHALATFPDLDIRQLRSIQRSYSNAFKHMTERNGRERNDAQLLLQFNDKQNDATLFVGWYDYFMACSAGPLEAQVFQVWYFALHPKALAEHCDLERYASMFPEIARCSRREQKQKLREVIERHRSDEEIMNDPKTDPRPLMLPAA